MFLKQNNFYVYLHKDGKTNLPIYIGMGTKSRAWECSIIKRNSKWADVFKLNGVIVEILYNNLTQSEAYSLEIETIKKYKDLGFKLLNISFGGKGGQLGVDPWNKGTVGKYSESHKKKIEQAGRKRFSNLENRHTHSVKCGGKPFEVYDLSTKEIIWSGFSQKQCERDLNSMNRWSGNFTQGWITRVLRSGLITRRKLIFRYKNDN